MYVCDECVCMYVMSVIGSKHKAVYNRFVLERRPVTVVRM